MGVVTTIAGDITTHPALVTSGYRDGVLLEARFHGLEGIALEEGGEILYVAERGNHRVRKIDLLSGQVTSLAGNGTQGGRDGAGEQAMFHQPRGLAVQASGDLFVADSLNYAIRKIDPAGMVSLYAGAFGQWQQGDGARLQARFSVILDVASNRAERSLSIVDTNNHRLRKIDALGEVTTLAGSGRDGHRDGDAAQALFYGLSAIATDNAGGVYVTDTVNSHRVRKIDGVGRVTTLAGSGGAGYRDGAGSQALLNAPSGLVYEAVWNTLLIADTRNHRLRRLDLTSLRVSTLAGDGTAGFRDGESAQARFREPTGVAVDAAGMIYLADTGNHRIRKIDPQTWLVTTLAGTGVAGFQDGAGTQAIFRSPSGLAVDAAGNLYIADRENHRVRRIDGMGRVTTLAGTGVAGHRDGAGAQAMFRSPNALVLDAAGNVYVADTQNNRIRRITPTGEVSTLSGMGMVGYLDGAASQAMFGGLLGIAVHASGEIVVTDPQNNTVRKID
jgi:DNA-binding beta-propeller fold protein YncE